MQMTIERKENNWDEFFESLNMFSDDFMIERNQPIELEWKNFLLNPGSVSPGWITTY